MNRACNLISIGLYLSVLLYRTHSFVLLTANVDDLKRIAQKLVSDSLADKIARFIIEAADNHIEFTDNSTITKNLSEYNDEFDVEKRDTKPEYLGEFRHKSEVKAKDQKQVIPTTSTVKAPETVEVQKKKVNKKKKHSKSKNKTKKENKVTADTSSLEYYKSDKHLKNINPNSIIDLEKMQISDDSSIIDLKQSRKEFNFGSVEKIKSQANSDRPNAKTYNYIEGDVSVATKAHKDTLENASEDFNYSNRVDTKSEKSTRKTNVTTEIERNEFDQYFNTNYPKADVVATSGPVELTKPTKTNLSDSDYV